MFFFTASGGVSFTLALTFVRPGGGAEVEAPSGRARSPIFLFCVFYGGDEAACAAFRLVVIAFLAYCCCALGTLCFSAACVFATHILREK